MCVCCCSLAGTKACDYCPNGPSQYSGPWTTNIPIRVDKSQEIADLKRRIKQLEDDR